MSNTATHDEETRMTRRIKLYATLTIRDVKFAVRDRFGENAIRVDMSEARGFADADSLKLEGRRLTKAVTSDVEGDVYHVSSFITGNNLVVIFCVESDDAVKSASAVAEVLNKPTRVFNETCFFDPKASGYDEGSQASYVRGRELVLELSHSEA